MRGKGRLAVTEGFRRRGTDSAYCYYSQYFPTVVDNAHGVPMEGRLISPLVAFREESDERIAAVLHEALHSHVPDLDAGETADAFQEALGPCSARHGPRGRRLPRGPSASGAISARRAHGQALRGVRLGASISPFPAPSKDWAPMVYWQDELDIARITSPRYANKYLERMHWHFGRQVMRTAELAARTENLYPVFLTCFRCSPDAFLLSYVKDILSHYGKPFLILQLDAHASDVGYATRIEAALQSFQKPSGEGMQVGGRRAPSRSGRRPRSRMRVTTPCARATRCSSPRWTT